MSTRARTAVLVAVCVAFLAQACSFNSPMPTTENVPVGLPVSDEDHELALLILRTATSVDTFRVRGSLDYDDIRRLEDPRFKRRFIGGFPIIDKGRTKGPDFARKICAFLTDPYNFLPAGTPRSKCIFDPGVAFRVRSGSDQVEVIICFTCGQLSVDSTKGRLRLPTDEFYPGFSRMSALAKEAFPKDKQLAALR